MQGDKRSRPKKQRKGKKKTKRKDKKEDKGEAEKKKKADLPASTLSGGVLFTIPLCID
ncbi:hypothetical protein IX321_000244 [Bacteroides pyogenes]|nr:hypothetical protein [Bacteroides pyogenes]MBR8716281.1 hypothetical protein [Bacteroides pyogenes]MBR8725922.1 hypothetical protein [Bacteroides pyogenes]MBR8739202.1 hypothetical protein [Bacteroides pyogenes]MBR8745783.1 hypothetical protein [Bacteroides pyogenes]